MYISQLNIHGFKSFARKENLTFGEGITAVVGPNGCGKTNIVDAIRWVLGEQKYKLLRSSKMEDVIFNGSDSHKPLNVCEVSLVVHNDKGILPVDYNDVEITRKVFRNGDSEYLINKKSCRLKDIQNLFMDTGMGSDSYSVIELKMVEDILSETAEDRRRMFEEAAGINRYKKDRKSTLNRLDATLADLHRVTDISSEVEAKVKGLQLQLKRFDRHIVLTNKLKDRELEVAFIKKNALFQSLKPLEQKVGNVKLEMSNQTDHDQGQEDVLKKLQETYKEHQNELEQIQTELDEISNARQESHNKILVLNEQIKSSQQTVSRFNIESKDCVNRIKNFQHQISEYKNMLKSLRPALAEKEQFYHKKTESFSRIDQKFQQIEEKLDVLNNYQYEHLSNLNDTQSLKERNEEILNDKADTLKKLESKAEELEKNLANIVKSQKSLIKERKKLELAISSNRKELEIIDTQLEKKREMIQTLSHEFRRIANQVEVLETQLQFYKEIIEKKEGYSTGVRYVLNHINEYPDVLGTVADLIRVEEKYRNAIEAGLDKFLYALVCKTRKSALKLLNDLQSKKVGRVSIIPLDSLKNIPPVKFTKGKGDGFIGCASEFVEVDDNMKKVINLLLGGMVIVKDSKAADNLMKTKNFNFDIADLSGRFYNRIGVISSVKGKDDVSILGRDQKVEELDKEIEKLIKESQSIQENIKHESDLLENLESHQKSLMSDQLGNHIDLLASLEKEISNNEFTSSQYTEQLREITHQIVHIRKEIISFRKSKDQLLPQLEKMLEQKENYESKIQETKEHHAEIKLQRDKENEKIQDARFQMINMENECETVELQIHGCRDNINELTDRINQYSTDIEQKKSQIVGMKGELDESEEKVKQFSGQYKKRVSVKNLKTETLSQTYLEIEKLQQKIRDDHREREKILEDMKRMELKIADLNRQTDLIDSKIDEKYRLTVPSTFNVTHSENELELEIDRIERSIERIGPVNWAVKEEFDEEQKRLNFINQQLEDLRSSEESLMETIMKIDTRARTLFTDIFNQIRKNFQKTFTVFFEGGEGDLELKGEDPLEADIVIFAKPPGKRTRHLRMLSSGEKALTAIALLFSIYQVKPSPFCILDEVDAPLDDNNILKFAQVLNKFTSETQFIVITHNKLTMEAAKYYYGVTMDISGVSRIVSVKFD